MPKTQRRQGGLSTAAERQEAIACFERDDYQQAGRLLVSLLARTRADPMLLRLCGMALVRSDAVAQGLGYLARARRLDPGDALSMLWHGIALQAAGRSGEAVTALEACVTATPADPVPLVHLSRALLRLHRRQDAAAAARRALTLAPGLLDARHAVCLAELAILQDSAMATTRQLCEAWLALAESCLRLDKVTDAHAALTQALAAQPLHAEAETVLALVEHLGGSPVAAIARLRDVLGRDPDCLAARLALASRLLLDHEPAAALTLLEQAPPGEPVRRARWQACRISALTGLGRYHDADAELARVAPPVGEVEIVLRWQHSLLARAAGDHGAAAALADRVARLALDRGAAGLEDRIDAHFSLAALRHAEGRTEQAFGHWRHGHELLRTAQPFSRAEHLAMLDAVMRAASRERLADGARAAIVDPAPVFIVGLPRTGTTLAEQILSAHPEVHGLGERLAIRETLIQLTGTTDATTAAGGAARLEARVLTDAARCYLRSLHDAAPDARRILDKMPDNFTQLGFIATLLPGARVICCTRDLRDVGASIFQQRFLGHHPYAHDLADLGWTIAQHQRLLEHWRSVLSIPMLELDHADWITDFDATLRRVLAFIDLPWDPACHRFFEQDRAVRTASRDQVRLPINPGGVGRWRAYAEQLAPMLRELPG